MTECIHELDPEYCSICKHGPRKTEREQPGFHFIAKYDSQCPECDLPIYIGQFCVKSTKDRVTHLGCI